MQTRSQVIRSKIQSVLRKYPSAYDEVIIADLYTAFNELLAQLNESGETTWNHPAIRAVKSVCKETIPPGLMQTIIDTVGGSPDVDKLKACYTEWHSRGKARGGWGWILEWYRDGIPERFKKDNGERSLPFDV